MTVAYPFIIDMGVATLSAYDDQGFLGIGVDGQAKAAKIATPEALHTLGLMVRPLDPRTDDDGNILESEACVVLRLIEDNSDHAIALGDPRCTPGLPRIPKGSALFYGPTGTDDPPRILASGQDDGLTLHVGSTAKITIEVEGGPVIVIDNGAVHAGGVGGFPAVYDNGLTAWFGTVVTALAAAGHPISAPPAIAATKVKVT